VIEPKHAKMLPRSITHLNLFGSDIEDDAIQFLPQNLTSLKINRDLITVAGLKSLLALATLTELQFDNGPIMRR